MLTTVDKPFSILFAGGCHVVGYPIGEERAFPALVARRLRDAGLGVRPETLSHLKLAHRQKLTAKCNQVKPDALVLQLGHAELNQQLSKYFRSRLGLPGHRAEKGKETPALSIHSVARFRFR